MLQEERAFWGKRRACLEAAIHGSPMDASAAKHRGQGEWHLGCDGGEIGDKVRGTVIGP